MQTFQKLSKTLNDFFTVPSTDPDDARRRKLLNFILGGSAFFSLLGILFGISFMFIEFDPPANPYPPIVAGLAMLSICVVFFLINRNRILPGWVTSFLFLVMLLIVVMLSDDPSEVVDGRSSFAFTIPIIMASVLMRPINSFVFAALSNLQILFFDLILGKVPNMFLMMGLFMVAFIVWLSANSLENALKDLRNINTNLDNIITDRTNALVESIIREQFEASRSQAVLDSIAEAVIVFDDNARVITANPSSERLLDLPMDKVINAQFEDLVHSDKLSKKSRENFSMLIPAPAGPASKIHIEWGQRTLAAGSTRIESVDGHSSESVIVFHDLSREAEIEKMKDTFVAMASHELRTPLNAILGYTEMLRDGHYGQVNNKQQGILDRIMVNIQRLLHLVRDLLDQAQIEAGRLNIENIPFKPAQLLTSVHEIMDLTANEKELELSSTLDASLPEIILGDQERLQQILVNLVSNAIKYSDKGSIHIRLYSPEETRWVLEVSDTGHGIPEREIPYIFDIFRQVDRISSHDQHGSGLGLAIVKKLVELMGGSIKVDSTVGSGSIFRVSLPLVNGGLNS